MHLYFLFIRIAAFFGHRKARDMVRGQRHTIGQLQALSPAQGPTVWIHAASVGEFEQARPIIELLKSEQPQTHIVVTFFSPSGYNLRKDYRLADAVVYLPFAIRRNARNLLNVMRPDIAVFVKYEWWPAYLKELAKRNIPTYSISAIFRPHQLFFLPWGKPYKNLLKVFKTIFVQDDASKQLLLKHGIDHVQVAGDTRFDRVQEIANLAKDLPVIEAFTSSYRWGERTPWDNTSYGRIIIAGSTWNEDEKLLARYLHNHPEVRLILAPHEIHDAHLHQIFELFEGRYVRLTDFAGSSNEFQPARDARVLVVDTIGLLSSIYRYGHVAYIGGGFGAGIHNTIEAAVFDMPVIFGPKYEHFREAKALIAAGGGQSVKNYSQLEQALEHALANHESMGRLAGDYVRSELGATHTIYNEIFTNARHLNTGEKSIQND